MADKGNDSSRTFSASSSDSEDVSDGEKNHNTIPSFPSINHQEHGGDNSGAIEHFLEQVGASASSSNNVDDSSPAKKVPKMKGKEKELKRAKRMIIPPECQCHLNNGQPCHTRFSVSKLMDTRMHYMNISKKELDIAVLAKLECGMHLTKMTTRKKRKPTERKKHRTDFYHQGYRICNVIFVYLHGFSYKKLKALILQYKTNGVKTRIHKNHKPKTPDEEMKTKKKKPKPKAKTKVREQKSKKPRLITNRKEKKEGANTPYSESNPRSHYENTTHPKVHQPPSPPAPPPPPSTSLPPPHHHYPVAFSMTSQSNHPHASPTAFMPAPHNAQPGFPHTVGYNPTPLFSSHPMSSHSQHHQSELVTNHNIINPPLDFSGQRGLPNPPLDFSSQRSNPSNMQGYQPGTGHPCVTYSVHNVPF